MRCSWTGNGRRAQDRTLIDLVNTWSFVHYYRGTIDEWVALLRAHLHVAERIDDLDARCLYLACLGNALWFNGDVRGSLDALDRAIALVPAGTETEGVRHARAWRAHTLMMMGRLERSGSNRDPLRAAVVPGVQRDERGGHRSRPRVDTSFVLVD